MMSQGKADETYYDILKVDRKATIAEVVAAYHSLKNAFSRDSVATYSLFSPEEAKTVLDRLEEAYLNLSNIDKKREYDRWLEAQQSNPDLPPMTELTRMQAAQQATREQHVSIFPESAPQPGNTVTNVNIEPSSSSSTSTPVDSAPIPVVSGDAVSGPVLRNIREKRGLSIDDVSRITKIPAKFIRAIEADDLKQLPARVYLQGFVKNMALLYKMDPKQTLKAYFEYSDKLSSPAAAAHL